jgi:hypothetical protein
VNTLHEAALTWLRAGFSVLPILSDGSKAPALQAWTEYTKRAPSEGTVAGWFGVEGHHGLGVVMGAVSGNAEMLELEPEVVHHYVTLRDLAEASGLGELWARVDSYRERSGGGGLHWIYRVDGDPVPGATKLAMRDTTPAEREKAPARAKTLAETKGEGGQTIAAPTPGAFHPNGGAWVLLAGDLASVPTITGDERAALHDLFRTLDQRAPVAPAAPRQPGAPRGEGGPLPGEDYEERTDWSDILGPHGWTHVFTRGTTRYWRRPGKNIGVSATTGHAEDRDRLYVFTSSSEFEIETPYTKFGAYALLEHDGDHSAAARELGRLGYGTPPTSGTGAGAFGLQGLIPSPSLSAAVRAASSAAPALTLVVGDSEPGDTEPAPADGADRPRTSWFPRDLAPILSGEQTEAPPAFLRRADGACAFYAGRVNGLIAASESGKTWVALHAVAQALGDGHAVLYLDFEDAAPGIIARLRALGCDATLLERFHYADPDAGLDVLAREDVADTLRMTSPALIVVDGVNAAMTLMGLDLNSNTDATAFAQRLLKPLSNSGAAVVYVDHLPKNNSRDDGERKAAGGIGAQAKRAMTTGCALRVDVVRQPAPGQLGKLALIVDKDRAGLVRGVSSARGLAGTFVLDATGPDGRIFTRFEAPTVARDENGAPAPFRPTLLMQRVSDLLQTVGGALSTAAIEDGVKGKAETVRDALRVLVAEGYVRQAKGPRGALLHELAKPYRQCEDPQASDDGPFGLQNILPNASQTGNLAVNDLVPTSSRPSTAHQAAESSESGRSEINLTSSHLVPPRPDLVPDEVNPPETTSSLVPPPYGGDEDERPGVASTAAASKAPSSSPLVDDWSQIDIIDGQAVDRRTGVLLGLAGA